jgi:hypothetical protein
MSTLSRQVVAGLRRRIKALTATAEKGFGAVEWIFLIVGILVIAGIVIAAVTAFVNTQVGNLPG